MVTGKMASPPRPGGMYSAKALTSLYTDADFRYSLDETAVVKAAQRKVDELQQFVDRHSHRLCLTGQQAFAISMLRRVVKTPEVVRFPGVGAYEVVKTPAIEGNPFGWDPDRVVSVLRAYPYHPEITFVSGVVLDHVVGLQEARDELESIKTGTFTGPGDNMHRARMDMLQRYTAHSQQQMNQQLTDVLGQMNVAPNQMAKQEMMQQLMQQSYPAFPAPSTAVEAEVSEAKRDSIFNRLRRRNW